MQFNYLKVKSNPFLYFLAENYFITYYTHLLPVPIQTKLLQCDQHTKKWAPFGYYYIILYAKIEEFNTYMETLGLY